MFFFAKGDFNASIVEGDWVSWSPRGFTLHQALTGDLMEKFLSNEIPGPRKVG